MSSRTYHPIRRPPSRHPPARHAPALRAVRFSTRVAAAVALGVVLAALRADESGDAPANRVEYGRPRKTGVLRHEAITECSGIVASRRNPGIFWVHNDSGDSPRVFAVDLAGELVAELLIRDATANDWEDIAIGPGPREDRSYLYIADTGNNDGLRAGDLCIYRVVEPSLQGIERGKRWRSRPAEKIQFVYDDRSRFDCEGLAVDPATGDIYLFTKSFLLCKVFRIAAPRNMRAVHAAKHVGTLRVRDTVTAADLSPDGRRLLLRTYLGLQEHILPEGKKLPEILRTQPRRLVAPRELQSEAACYGLDGSVITTSEGRGAPIHRLAVIPPTETSKTP